MYICANIKVCDNNIRKYTPFTKFAKIIDREHFGSTVPAESRKDVEAQWKDLRAALSSAAEEHLGPRPKGIQPELQSKKTATVVRMWDMSKRKQYGFHVANH